MPNIINVYSLSKDPRGRLLSNFAPAPFILDGEPIATIESFHQGIKFKDLTERRRVFGLSGADAKAAGKIMNRQGKNFCFWGNRQYPWRGEMYYALQHRALLAKFTQNQEAAEALLATENALFKHYVPRGGKTLEEFQKTHTCQSLYAIRTALANPVSLKIALAVADLALERAKLGSALESLDTAIRILSPLSKTKS